MQLNRGINIIIFACNAWRFNIYRECWTICIAFQTKKTPENRFKLFIFYVRKFCRDEKKDQLNLQLMPFQGLTGPRMQFPPTSGVIWSETDMKYAHGNFFFYRKRDNIHNVAWKPKTVFGYLSLSWNASNFHENWFIFLYIIYICRIYNILNSRWYALIYA